MAMPDDGNETQRPIRPSSEMETRPFQMADSAAPAAPAPFSPEQSIPPGQAAFNAGMQGVPSSHVSGLGNADVMPGMRLTGSWSTLLQREKTAAPKIWTSTHIATGQVDINDEDGSFELPSALGEDPLIGAIIEDRYEIVEIIGRGGMAVVYLARHIPTNRPVAMKAIKVQSAEDIMRFAREIRSHSRLSHPNIVEYMEFIATSTSQFFLVMERIKGLSLLDIVRSISKIDGTENIAGIMWQSCDALAYAHSNGVIHRDLKSSNIVLVKEGERDDLVVKILDFGIAKVEGEERITFSGRAIGSPIYMAPEQCRGETLTARSDLYSLGVVAYEMFTGKPPYCQGTVRDIMAAHCTPQIIPRPVSHASPEIPCVHLLDQIVQKCLETDPSDRFQTATQLKEAFEFWYDAVRNNTGARSLPAEMLDTKSQSETFDDKDFSLSKKERKELRNIKRTTTMQAQFGTGSSTDLTAFKPELTAEHKDEQNHLRSHQASYETSKKKLIMYIAITAILGLSLIAYFTTRVITMMSEKGKPAAITKPAATTSTTGNKPPDKALKNDKKKKKDPKRKRKKSR